MADDIAPEIVEAPPPAPRRTRRRFSIWRLFGGLLLLLFLFVAAIGLGVDTDAGHRFIIDRIAEMRPANGLRIRIGRIDGSIWRHVHLRDLRVYDTKGLFLEAPDVDLDWHPTRWLAHRLDIDRLSSDLVILRRKPVLRPTGKPFTLPGYRIHIGKVDLKLRLEPPVAGARHLVHVIGHADTAHGRAVIGLRASSTAGDRMALALDTEPDRDIFSLSALLASPANGVVPGLFGAHAPVAMLVDGRGKWTGWRGRATLDIGKQRIASLALTESHGRYALSGRLVPASITHGKLHRLTAPLVEVTGAARYADRKVDGQIRLRSSAMALTARGVVDLADDSFHGLGLDWTLLKAPALFPNMSGALHVHAVLDGPFRTAAFRYVADSPRFAFDQTGFEQVRAEGRGHLRHGGPVVLPIRMTARRVTGVGDVAGGILANLSVTGELKVTRKLLTGEGLTLRSDKLNGKLALFVDLRTGRYAVDLSGGMRRYLIPGLGIVDVLTELKVLPGPGDHGTIVQGHGKAWVRRFDNAFLRSLAGGLPVLDTELVRTPDGLLHFSHLRITAPAITITGAGMRRHDGSIQFTGQGAQAVYGAFKIALDGMIDHPKINLLLASPVKALGLSAVKLDLDPIPGGFTLQAAGGSTLGPFTGTGAILTPPGGLTTVRVDALHVTGTTAKGALVSHLGGFQGSLAVMGGGLSGRLDFAPVGDNQRILVHLAADRAKLAGEADLGVRRGKLDADLLLDPAGTRITGTTSAQGLKRGSIFLARLNASARLVGGNGTVNASVAGSRGRAFAFKTVTTLAPNAVTVRGDGQIDGKPVTLATPATLRREGDGWRLQPTRFGFSGGSATVAGLFGGSSTAFEASLDGMPLSVLDLLKPGLGLGGEATGRLRYAAPAGAEPSGRADLRVRGLTRAGLVLSSTPVDVGLAAALDGGQAAVRAIAASGGKVIGRAQAQLKPLPAAGSLIDRLTAAPLFAQLRYSGPSDTLWRLTGIETIDLSGPVAIGADVRGTLENPRIEGSLATSAARLESTTTGTIIDHIHARGRFNGSRLLIDQFSGATRDNGSVSGRAAFDFAAKHGLGMDIALNANHAVLLNRDDIAATVTGQLTIRSDGRGGTIGGDVRLDKARYQFGRAAAATIPRLAVTELNRPADVEEIAPPAPWTLDLKTNAPNQLFVRGLGLDSEWRAKLAIKGSVDNPAITGRADLIRGNYEFAGRRFDIDRGIIRFSGQQPVDPALDITAGANIQGLSATIRVTGTGQHPEISFTSTPALPEDELLSRLLFGTSIQNLSAPEALQLAAAVASLREGGKGGLDPINAVRKAVGLDRLRIEPADVTTGQKTSIAAGKYIGRRTYVELVTDGQGYSATRIEFQVTRWLSLLSTISTIGRESAKVRISKDY